jgi:hypothetical protein
MKLRSIHFPHVFLAKLKNYIWASVAHTHKPNYMRGRDKEDQGSKPTWANSS